MRAIKAIQNSLSFDNIMDATKKILIIFYSRTGTTKKVGYGISGLLNNAEFEELIDETRRLGLFKFFKSCFDAMGKKLTTIRPTRRNLAEYDVIAIGTPVWAGNMAPAIRTYITNNKEALAGKQLAFFCTCGGSGNSALKKLGELVGKSPIATLALKKKEVITENHKEKLKEFVDKLKA